jgi:alkylation response protein AidB-like acyl-CoA dehydrogenase
MSIKHPSTFIEASVVDQLRSFIIEAEKKGSLHDEQLKIIFQHNWFNLFVPKLYNGLELSLPEALQIEEALAWIDGSLGWTVTLCSGANWFAGFIEAEMAKTIFSNNKICLAGSGKPSGIAKIIDDGYEISGYWSYATGSIHATVFTANCIIEKDGFALKNEDGTPLINAFLLLKDEVKIIKDWKYIGMKATSSYSFEVKDVKVPANRKFIIDKNYLVTNSPVYNFPFIHFAEATLAVNFSGMAIRFFELYETLSTGRKHNSGSEKKIPADIYAHLVSLKTQFDKIRNDFYNAVNLSWSECIKTNTVSDELLQEVSKTSRALAANARRLASELYPYCGLNAANIETDINRLWRDFHTASQHPLLLYDY